jgi:nucleotide-binding universal stress UspA family protein
MFQRCLICTDFTDGLQKLIHFVPSLVKGGLKEIIFLHSVPLWEEGEVPRVDQDKIDKVKQKLSPALDNIAPNVKVIVEVPSGEPLETIPKAVKNYNVDFVVIATPLRSAWQDKLFGSTSMGLAKSLKVPLMMFRPQLISVYTEEELALRCEHLTRSLLIPYNGEEQGEYLVERIKHYASTQPENSLKHCVLVSVVEDASRSKILEEHHLKEAQMKLNQIKTDLEKLDLTVETVVKQGNRLNIVLDVAYEYDISAIAVAPDKEHSLLEWTVPSFSQEVLHRCWFPLVFFIRKN